MKDIKNKIGVRIRNLREEHSWSQEELAHRSEISLSHMGRLERGERGATIHSLEKVTNALGITFEDLFRFINPEYENRDMQVLNTIITKLSKRSLNDQKIILKLIDILLPWKDIN